VGVNKIMSNYRAFKKDVQKVIMEMNKALKILEKIQSINQETIDRERLYTLLIKSEFNQNNYPQVKKEKSLLIDLLSKLRDIYHAQESMCFGSNNLELFCYKIFWLKEYKVF
tara:strand:- start:18 stop:353 length:336 start_codon:yes stop_codon:yes gene_type:complete